MTYLYEFEIVQSEDLFVAVPFDWEGATQGRTSKELAEMLTEWLRISIEHCLMHNLPIPEPSFGNKPKNGGEILVALVETDLSMIKRVSASEAARILNVSPARISHMIRDGLLEAFKDGHKTWVTIDSINARLGSIRRAGRPKKEPTDDSIKRKGQKDISGYSVDPIKLSFYDLDRALSLTRLSSKQELYENIDTGYFVALETGEYVSQEGIIAYLGR